VTLRSHPGVYDTIGRGYSSKRRPDPRIAAQLHDALGSASRICSVGAGAGSYEPSDRSVVAVEPSREMLRQRGPGPVLRAVAERLPIANAAFDAVMAVLTLHHWVDAEAGLSELCRIAPRRVVLSFDPSTQGDFWLVRDYLPDLEKVELHRAPSIERVATALGAQRVEVVPVPWDCTDGFQAAYWRRPEMYLDPEVRASISSFAQLGPQRVAPGLRRLAEDLASGAWRERYADLLERESMDWGYRLIVAEA
jgi:SAM-dependent methyltransferase